MAQWKRREQESEGTYMFNGEFFCTQGIIHEIPIEEITWLYKDIIRYAQEQNGIDYLQVYEDENGRIIYFIDNLNREHIQSGKYATEDNYCTLLFSYEY